MKRSMKFLLMLTVSASAIFAGPRVIQMEGTLDDFEKLRYTSPKAGPSFAAAAIGAASNASDPAIPNAIPGINSISNFAGSFQYQGKTYPYIMAGTNPATGQSSKITVNFIPLTLEMGDGSFFESVDTTYHMADSPLFNSNTYATGDGQFIDAEQRAQFWNTMPADRNWHFLLDSMVSPEEILKVPDDYGLVIKFRSGQKLAVVDTNYFAYVLESIVAKHPNYNALVMATTHNMVLSDVAGQADPLANCCILGFHSATSETHGTDGIENVQTYGFGSWLDQGFFRSPNIADIHGLSHEIAEWANDPFINNVVPPWTTPSAGQYGCTTLLETGDPIVGFSIPIAGYDGFLFHPQDEALLQWFARTSPSNAIHGAYSFPDERALPGLPLNCTPK